MSLHGCEWACQANMVLQTPMFPRGMDFLTSVGFTSLQERFDHPYTYFLFYGMDSKGDFIPSKQLREKYNAARHELPWDEKDDSPESPGSPWFRCVFESCFKSWPLRISSISRHLDWDDTMWIFQSVLFAMMTWPYFLDEWRLSTLTRKGIVFVDPLLRWDWWWGSKEDWRQLDHRMESFYIRNSITEKIGLVDTWFFVDLSLRYDLRLVKYGGHLTYQQLLNCEAKRYCELQNVSFVVLKVLTSFTGSEVWCANPFT